MRRSKLTKSVTALAALAAGAGSVLAGAPAAEAAAGAELKLTAADDTYVSSGRRNATFGAEQKLAIGRLAGDSKTAFLKFVVPAGTQVTGARLTLETVGDVTGRLTLNRVADTAWTEKKLTSATAPALGTVVGTAAPKADAAEVSFDLGATVTGPGAYAFALRSSATSAVTRFRAAEGKSGGPVLLVATGSADETPAAPVEAPDPVDETVPPAQPATPVEDEDMPPPPAPATGDCVTGKLLVPSCGVLWGAAAGGFTSAPRDAALKDWEKLSGRTASIFHTYHKGDEPFPTKSEMA
ncbi:CBM96 family carbohydrate-binding protein, partial [Nucisporomicrobium flavum]|uniref:CBM96 family carbohydrate-binding protein n=1 Tax=Nucisporomicrobium flavum TaxID=2785915 RepID=UPI0027DCADCD